MSGAELAHWIAFYELDPWTEDRADWRGGLLCAVLANVMTGKTYEPADFVPQFKAADEVDADGDADKLMLQGLNWVAQFPGAMNET